MISRLSNSEWGLSAPAMIQLYYSCITPIADYGAKLRRKGQIGLAGKFEKLQSEANRRTPEVFRTSPTPALEIEASTLPVPLRLDRLWTRYAYRVSRCYQIIWLDKQHPQPTPQQWSLRILNLNHSTLLAQIQKL